MTPLLKVIARLIPRVLGRGIAIRGLQEVSVLEAPKFEFKRFKPSQALLRKAEAVLLHLIDFIPSDAAVFVCLSKKLKNKYNCLIHIKAHDTQFVQDISAEDPTSAIDSVTQRIKDEILRWKVENLIIEGPSFWNFKEVK